MNRREVLMLLGGAATTWPRGAWAQQGSAMPVIGFLDGRTPEALTERLRGFRQGLKEVGYVDGENVTIVYRWAENQIDRLPALAADLVLGSRGADFEASRHRSRGDRGSPKLRHDRVPARNEVSQMSAIYPIEWHREVHRKSLAR